MTEHTPFLKWAGGKRWLSRYLAPVISEILSSTGGKYYEPFLGSGSMFFSVLPNECVLSDLNNELIDTYIQIRDSWSEVESVMKKWEVTKSNYYFIRNLAPTSKIEQAARFIWLNRTCYGGLYRVNRQNKFNVPYGGGRSPETLFKNNTLQHCSNALKNNILNRKKIQIIACDFERSISNAVKGDVVYCDPTYSCINRTSFDRYGSVIFDWPEQQRLSKIIQNISERGVITIVSNAFSNEIFELFKSNYMFQLTKKKTIGNIPSNDRTHNEYLFINDFLNKSDVWKNLKDTIREIQKSF